VSEAGAWRPTVSVVIPMLDELGYVADCLEGFARQTYPLDLLDVIVVDGGSRDGSRELVEELADGWPWLRVVENPERKAAAAFNRGVDAAKGEVVCLFSAHGVPAEDYVERSVAVLAETGAAGVGGRVDHVGTLPVASAIGLAMASPFGMASVHRFAGARVEVDTISHPAYLRSWLARVGPFDESLGRNSDYEMNWRLRAAGGRLVADPSIRSTYRPRRSLGALARQFWWYGWWKAEVVRRHPASRRARHAVPPAAVGLAAALVPLSWWRPARRAGVALGTAYGALVAVATVHARRGRPDVDTVTLAAAFPVMHASWGAGYLAGAIRRRVR
jgi:succinoglycan biosynthesis protein ExoA